MIADILITEKSFGPKVLMTGVKFSIGEGEKIGVIGRNGVGKSTLFGILAGMDKDFTGEVIYHRGTVVVATQQEHHNVGKKTVLQYVLAGLPEYAALRQIIETYPQVMGGNMKKIEEYTKALERFSSKGFYRIEEQIERELENFQLSGAAHRPFLSLSGGQKRLVEVVKIMHSQAQLALVDEPTNHMDFVAKAQFIDWLKTVKEAALVITHDRDVLKEVNRIIELKDGGSQSFKGNYDAYLKQNAVSTGAAMTEFELVERRKNNLKDKIIQFRRLKEKARDPDTIKQFKRRENEAKAELEKLERIEKPTFWIDKASVEDLNYKVASRYDKYKARTIRMNLKNEATRSKHILVSVKDLSLGYDSPLFEGVNIDLREGEALELRGRNGAGKTTIIKALLASRTSSRDPSIYSIFSQHEINSQNEVQLSLKKPASSLTIFGGEIFLDPHARVGIYEQEINRKYFGLPLEQAIERMYLDRNLAISTTKIYGLMKDYLFTDGDSATPLSRLSGGQKARFQLIAMLANDPQLLILDEPTNHLDLPSIEELETALARYTGAILYVSHDGYFQRAIGGDVLEIGTQLAN